MTTSELAAASGLSAFHVRRLAAQGAIPTEMTLTRGRHYRFKRCDKLDVWIKRQRLIAFYRQFPRIGNQLPADKDACSQVQAAAEKNGIKGVVFTPTGLRFPKGITFEEWQKLGGLLGRLSKPLKKISTSEILKWNDDMVLHRYNEIETIL